MAESDAPPISFAQKFWALAAALLFLFALAFLGFALNTGLMMSFAIGWVGLQAFGYVGALKFAKGDVAHPLFISQVMLHLIAFALLIALFAKATS